VSVHFAQHHRFTVDDLERMVEAGILKADDRVELIDGEIIEMTPVGSRHAACVRRLNAVLGRLLRGGEILSVQDPLRLEGVLQPLPDIAVLRPRDDFYAESHPTAGDTFFVVEVADSSVMYDRNVKAVRYARAGIPEYWLVDLTRSEVVFHTHPAGDRYQDVVTLRRGASIRSTTIPGLDVRVDEIFG
jgi:Uma2 family endonuclease